MIPLPRFPPNCRRRLKTYLKQLIRLTSVKKLLTPQALCVLQLTGPEASWRGSWDHWSV
jgi:hypothetical protein